MPQIFSSLSDLSQQGVHLMIWEIKEPLSFFEQFPKDWKPTHHHHHPLSQIKELESTAARFCLYEILKNASVHNPILWQNDRGRPYLKHSDWHISITHSYPFVAAICSKDLSIGIDLERFGRNIQKIGARFLSENEWKRWQNSEINLTKAWTCKEAIYKAMNVPGLSFQNEIILPEFGQIPAMVSVKGKENEISWEIFDQFSLAITRIRSENLI